MTDDDGGPSLHIVRPAYLDGERYFWFPQCAILKNTEYINNSSTLTDSALTLPINAGGTWEVSGVALFGQPDYTATSCVEKLQITAPSGSAGHIMFTRSYGNVGTADTAADGIVQSVNASITTASSFADADVRKGFMFSGVITGGTSAGSVTLQYAQNAAVNANLWLLSGWLKIQRIA